MIVAQADSDGGVTTLWRVKEMVGLGRISFPSHQLSREAMDRAIASLSRMKQSAQQRQAEKIVAVATSAIREAQNGGALIDRIRRELKLHVRVVSAREEARLIYLGVHSAIDMGKRPHLIIDIGGGSVEFIVGDNTEAKLLESRKLGAARVTAQFIKNDPPTQKQIESMIDHYDAELSPLYQRIRALKPVRVIGTSGTLENIAQMCGATEESRTIKLNQLEKLEKRLLKTTTHDRAGMNGLDDQRKDQIIAGVVLIGHVMRNLRITEIELCAAALREGILSDYLSRHIPDLQIRRQVPDPRRRSVLDLARRCNWYESHSTHVAKLTMQLFDHLKPLHKLPESARELIEYGAMLHDIGWHIGARGHHKHGEYLIRNGKLTHFTPEEIAIMSLIVRYHRKSGPNRKKHERFAALSREGREIVNVATALLRVADALDRSKASAITDVRGRLFTDRVRLEVKSNVDPQLEIWSARAKSEWFEKVFGRKVELAMAEK